MKSYDELVNDCFKDINEYSSKDTIKIESAKQGDVLYHYTGIKGLMGILKDRKFNFTKSIFLNDSLEIKYIVECVYDVLIDNKLKGNALYDELKKTVERTKNNESWNSEFINWNLSISAHNYYTVSFSLNQDSLMLWSYYSDFDGYNMGIDINKFVDELDTNVLSFKRHGKIIYDEIEQKKLIKIELDKAINIYNSYSENLKEEDLITIKRKMVEKFLSKVEGYALFFKHPLFKSEEEYRVVIENFSNQPNEYKDKNGIIIPYIEIGQKYDKLVPLKSIKIGPKNNIDVAEIGVKSYISNLGYKNEEVIVDKSKVPLRY